jgi:hypothetical protein
MTRLKFVVRHSGGYTGMRIGLVIYGIGDRDMVRGLHSINMYANDRRVNA